MQRQQGRSQAGGRVPRYGNNHQLHQPGYRKGLESKNYRGGGLVVNGSCVIIGSGGSIHLRLFIVLVGARVPSIQLQVGKTNHQQWVLIHRFRQRRAYQSVERCVQTRTGVVGIPGIFGESTSANGRNILAGRG